MNFSKWVLVLPCYICWALCFLLFQDYQNFMKYICDAFKGNPKPDACATLSTATITSEYNHHITSFLPVCYVDDQTQNLTSPLKSPWNSNYEVSIYIWSYSSIMYKTQDTFFQYLIDLVLKNYSFFNLTIEKSSISI